MIRVTATREVDHRLISYTLRNLLALLKPIKSSKDNINNTIAITLTDIQ
ncbi:MAG: hypothetical protein PHH67_10665 [Methanosarcina sp.]|nr:hypothetical protein [Methanosarcina sp.]